METRRTISFFAFVFVVGALLSAFTAVTLDDFRDYFYPALVEMARGRSPYTVQGLYTPPWGLLPLVPLGWLPYPAAKALFLGLCFVGIVYVPIRLRFPWWAFALYLLSPPVLYCLIFGNLDWVPLLALFVSPFPVGVLLAMVKPQVGIGILLFWLVTHEQRDYALAWLILACILSLLVYPACFDQWLVVGERALASGINIRLWPVGLLLGIPLVGLGIRLKKPLMALAAGPFLSPYTLIYSYCGLSLWGVGGDRHAQ